jgi:hypothetical protein
MEIKLPRVRRHLQLMMTMLWDHCRLVGKDENNPKEESIM